MKQRKSKVSLHDSSDSQENNTDLVDRISDLPDEILGDVLSFLPTKQALATSVLSKRWKFVWRTIHNIEFSYLYHSNEQIEAEAEDMEFIRFVNRVLLLHDSRLLNKFRLDWHPWRKSYDDSSWINTAIAKNVHDLYLSGQIGLPVSVFSCDSLQSLKLAGLISTPEEFEVCLPRLECLTISGVAFQSEEAFEKVISGCPMLNYLSLDHCYEDDFVYIVSSTSLRRVKLLFEEKCSLELKASSLEYLKIRGCMPQYLRIVSSSLSSLVEAYFSICLSEDELDQTDICDSIVEVVRAFDCVKVVSLSADVILALSGGIISLSTKFKRLVKLVAGTYCSSLQDLIQSSDNLQVLKIVQLHDYWCSIPAQVPRCLSSSLKTVRIGCYEGLKNELEMMRYMLKYGSVLENMKIFYHKKKDCVKFELLQEICEVPRKSPACKVEFNEWTLKDKYKKLL